MATMLRVGSRVSILFFSSVLVMLRAQVTITPTPTISPAGPQPVGTPVTITFGATDSGPGPVNYRLDVQAPGGQFQTVHDFNLKPSFVWAQNLVEGTYQLRITARDNSTQQQAAVVIPYTITSLVTGGSAVVTATSHPLVALFSAPPCPVGSSMAVAFYPQGTTKPAFSTDSRPCRSGTSMNFLIGGMYANTTYNMNYVVTTNGVSTQGPNTLQFTTGAIPSNLNVPTPFVQFPAFSGPSAAERILLTGCALLCTPFATDLAGNLVWYYGGADLVNEVNRMVKGGTLLTVTGGPNTGTGSGLWGLQTQFQVVEELDLRGYEVRDTNVDRVNEQLPSAAAVTDFNHESIRLPNGHTLVIGSNEQVFPAGTQGNAAPIAVIGDVIIDLDQNMQVAWYWNAFAHAGGGTQLSINRVATLGEQCSYNTSGNAQLGCPPVLLTNPANDWLHGNSLQLEPDGSILMSLRHQDWLIDIDYANGTGTGNILWRMGPGGDFTMLTPGQYPWFSHQHDAEFVVGGMTTLTALDNGDLRISLFGGNSRGMVLNVNVPNRIASSALAQDLGVYAIAEGSAQTLSNGDYMFESGSVPTRFGVGEVSSEYSATGTLTYSQRAATGAYRAFRVTDLYRPPNGAGVNSASTSGH